MFDNPWDFGTGFMAPPFSTDVGSGMPVAPAIDIPAILSGNLASAGIRPEQFLANPGAYAHLAAPNSPAPLGMGPFDGPGAAAPPQMDNSLDNSPTLGPGPSAPLSLAPTGAPTDISAAAKQKTMADKFAESLKGVKAPTAPTAQTIRTPGAPEPKSAIKPGELLALLSMLGATEQPKYQLPSTLGAALGGR